MAGEKAKKKKLVFLGGPLRVEGIRAAFAGRGGGSYRLKFIPRAEGFSPRETAGLRTLVVTDPLPGADWREFVTKFKFMNNTVPVLVLGACENDAASIEALRAGAHDRLSMDGPDFAAGLARAVDKAIARQDYDDRKNWLEGIFFENHARWLAFLDAITDFIFIADERQNIIKVNSALAGAYGKHPKDVTGMKTPELLGAELASELERMRKKRTAQPVEKKIGNDYYLVSVFPLMYENQDFTIYFLKKITEMRRLKEQLFHSDKLASIGLLVSGVAHEINNPLTGIIAYTELLKLKTPVDGRDDVIEKIMLSTDRCKKIVENLLTFSRQQTFARSFESINDIIDRTVELRSYWLRQSGIEVAKDYGAVPSLFVDAQQIQQVLLNVLINAEQAIADARPPDGKVAFRTSFDAGAKRLTISVTDNGGGVPEWIADKIFDPFFTTRSVGVGTGLGLSISHGIVTGHGGQIRVERAEEGGARFVIELPQKQAGEILEERAEKT